MSRAHQPCLNFKVSPLKPPAVPGSGPAPIAGLPDSLLLYIFELEHGEDTTPQSLYHDERSTIWSIIRVCKWWYCLGMQVMLSKIDLELGDRDRVPHFRRWLCHLLSKNESLRSYTHEAIISFAYGFQRRYEHEVEDVVLAEILQLLRWWLPSLQKVKMGRLMDSPVSSRAVQRLTWQLVKMPLKHRNFTDASLPFFFKYFHFPGLKRLSWLDMSWGKDPDQLMALYSESSAPASRESHLLASERVQSLDLQELSTYNPSLPADKLKTLLVACKTLRSFKLRYLGDQEDEFYTEADVQQLLDLQGESLREITLGHICHTENSYLWLVGGMIDFSRMPQLERLSLNADDVFAADPRLFASTLLPPRLKRFTIQFDTESQHGNCSREIDQCTHDWLVNFSIARSESMLGRETELNIHVRGHLEVLYINGFSDFDPAKGFPARYPWDYLKEAKLAVERYSITLT